MQLEPSSTISPIALRGRLAFTTFTAGGLLIDAVIAEIIEKGVTEDELKRAKNRLIADSVFAQDNQAMLARWYGVALTTGLSVERVQDWPNRIRTVTAEAVQEAARKWLDKRRSDTGYLVKADPKPEEKRS